MDLTEPIVNIKPQIQDIPPITLDGTLVDDPVALVDDPNALVGSQTTQIQSLGVSTSDNAPKGYIKVRR